MPEPPEVYAFAERINRQNKCLHYPNCKFKLNSSSFALHAQTITVRLHLHPRTWPVNYVEKTCHTNRSLYSFPTHSNPFPIPLTLDAYKSEGTEWEYLHRELEPGVLQVHPRAKQLVLACGPVSYGVDQFSLHHLMSQSTACHNHFFWAGVTYHGNDSLRL